MYTQSIECPSCGRIVKGYHPAADRRPEEWTDYIWIAPYRHKAGEGAWWAMPGEWCLGHSDRILIKKEG